MKIYSMTATFGKLDNATLTLEPGLNVIHAPNEWGKSTWCAFLVNMLYGIDTRARSTASSLADKERYAPWSGAPMAGRMDLCWKGRDITIERSTRGRVIFGNFRAYETHTGLDVPELNGANCGETLLGVERSVFTRSGFLRLGDLPVTQDDALRRRLNNLVTTGDESDDGDRLGETLKNLKNKCRHNRTGLLPQAETDREQLQQQLNELHDLQNRAADLRAAQVRLDNQISALRNHADALKYRAAEENRAKLAQAQERLQQAKQRYQELDAACGTLLPRAEAQSCLQRAQDLQTEALTLQQLGSMLPPVPAQPDAPRSAGNTAAAAADAGRYSALEGRKKKNGLFIGLYAIAAVAALVLGFLQRQWLPWCGLAVALAGIAVLAVCIAGAKRIGRELQELADRHPGQPPHQWEAHSQTVADQWLDYDRRAAETQAARADIDRQQRDLQARIDALTGGEALAVCIARWSDALHTWADFDNASTELNRCAQHHQLLQGMIAPVDAPRAADHLTYSAEETAQLLEEGRQKQQQLHSQLGLCQGKAETLGAEGQMRARLDTLNRRIQRLTDLYYALEMAQDSLRDAKLQLQRRFAPRISQRAQELFGRLTGGRYQRVTMGEDFALSTAADGEINALPAQWRSDGTVDQLYLALRLAVAEELTPETPLVLDDALVRFDDSRLALAMDILREAAWNKQIILFTCQSRESAHL